VSFSGPVGYSTSRASHCWQQRCCWDAKSAGLSRAERSVKADLVALTHSSISAITRGCRRAACWLATPAPRKLAVAPCPPDTVCCCSTSSESSVRLPESPCYSRCFQCFLELRAWPFQPLGCSLLVSESRCRRSEQPTNHCCESDI
jgi:hypothetical protein